MPKDARKRTRVHNPPTATGHIGTDSSSVRFGEPQTAQRKKEKQQLKRDALLKRLGQSGHSPYSKSYNRRLKRRAKEEIAGGLGEIQQVITSLTSSDHEVVSPPPAAKASADRSTTQSEQQQNTSSTSTANKRPSTAQIQIGKGKSATLTKAQRKRALQLERIRHPLVLSHPEFSANPFQTIRTHAQNTLVKHEAKT